MVKPYLVWLYANCVPLQSCLIGMLGLDLFQFNQIIPSVPFLGSVDICKKNSI